MVAKQKPHFQLRKGSLKPLLLNPITNVTLQVRTRSLVRKEDKNLSAETFGAIANYGNLNLNELADAGVYRAANDEIAAWEESGKMTSGHNYYLRGDSSDLKLAGGYFAESAAQSAPRTSPTSHFGLKLQQTLPVSFQTPTKSPIPTRRKLDPLNIRLTKPIQLNHRTQPLSPI